MTELHECNDRLCKMKSRIDKGSDWSDGREYVVYVKLHFNVRSHYIVVGICWPRGLRRGSAVAGIGDSNPAGGMDV
jgi:hypothetical protein